MNNPILEYWAEISAGRVIVSQKIARMYRKLAYDVEHPGEWYYSENRAEHVITFIEKYCKHSKGKFGGKSVRKSTRSPQRRIRRRSSGTKRGA